MGMCEKLKWNRKRLGMNQREFANLVGVSAATICKLETDETAWLTVRNETENRITAQFEKMSSWQPDKKEAGKVIDEISEESSGVTIKDNVGLARWKEIEAQINGEEQNVPAEETVNIPIVNPVNIFNEMTANDLETLTLMEFGFEGLFESTKHEEFVANMNIIRRIVNKYYLEN